MKVVYNDEHLYLENTVVVLGNFDGVHIAHQALIRKAVEISKANNLKVIVYTFYEHPKAYLGRPVSLITTNGEKEAIFEELGVDTLVYQHLNDEFLNMSPERFIEDIVIKKLSASYIVVGKHYTFGKNASGNCELLNAVSGRFNIKTHVEELLKMDDELIASSNVRKYLHSGNVERANSMLARNYSVTGEVVHGNHIGSEIGFPTANIVFPSDKIVPKHGVYACKTIIDDVEYNSIANIGVKPTIGAEKPLVEVHVLGEHKNFYGKTASVKICYFIREEIKFHNVNELSEQIKADVKVALEYFTNIDK